MKNIYLLSFLLLLFVSQRASAANGDTIKVITHQNVVMTTDTAGSGFHEKKRWAVFPAAGTSYRKAFVIMSYKCPSGMACGEWDYIDQIMLHRTGGVGGLDKNIELVRFITPYGNGINNSWSFAWEIDVTDFALFLHDSVEIGYVHTGFETYVNKGWDVTLEFNLVEGPWTMEPVAVTPLWNGSFPFGNDSNPIENYLTPIEHTFSNTTQVARVFVNQTGHGFDNNDGCSEFCNRYRQLKWDNALVDEVQLWRKCGFNALYPQGGTWLYDRGNWCPGAFVYPRLHDEAVQPGSTHTVNIDMEIYTDDEPSGNEFIRSYLIEYKQPTVQNDVRIDNIFRPNNFQEYTRINPVCDNPVIQVTNVGSNNVTSMQIECGYAGQSTFTYSWNGSLAPGKFDTIVLGNVTVVPTAVNQLFTVNVTNVNGTGDAYTLDNVASARATASAVLDSVFYLEVKTNAEGGETGYTLSDTWGNVYYQRAVGSMAASTVYKDTFYLPANNCYRLVIVDADPFGGDGLNWWANPDAGAGYARLRKVPGPAFIKTFNPDFGSRVEYNFTVGNVVSSIEETPFAFDVLVSPNPTSNNAVVDCLSPKLGDWKIEMFDVLGQRVYAHQIKNSYGEMLNVDVSKQPAGFYTLRISQNNSSVTRRLVVAR